MNQNAAIVATDPISYLESPGFLFSEPTAGMTAAPRRWPKTRKTHGHEKATTQAICLWACVKHWRVSESLIPYHAFSVTFVQWNGQRGLTKMFAASDMLWERVWSQGSVSEWTPKFIIEKCFWVDPRQYLSLIIDLYFISISLWKWAPLRPFG